MLQIVDEILDLTAEAFLICIDNLFGAAQDALAIAQCWLQRESSKLPQLVNCRDTLSWGERDYWNEKAKAQRQAQR